RRAGRRSPVGPHLAGAGGDGRRGARALRAALPVPRAARGAGGGGAGPRGGGRGVSRRTAALGAALLAASLDVLAQEAYQPTPANLAARRWFQEARFGLFIH